MQKVSRQICNYLELFVKMSQAESSSIFLKSAVVRSPTEQLREGKNIISTARKAEVM